MAIDVTAMTLAVRTRLGNPATDGFFTDAQILDLLNESIQYNNTLGEWPWTKKTGTISMTAGTNSYSLPNDWVKTRVLSIDGYDTMQELSLKEIRDKVTTEQGAPTYFCVENELIYVRPTPNSSYTVNHDYLQEEPILVNGTDVPLMPEQWRYAIVEYAAYLAHMRQGDFAAADRAMARHQKWYEAMADHRRRTTGGRRIRVRPGSGL